MHETEQVTDEYTDRFAAAGQQFAADLPTAGDESPQAFLARSRRHAWRVTALSAAAAGVGVLLIAAALGLRGSWLLVIGGGLAALAVLGTLAVAAVLAAETMRERRTVAAGMRTRSDVYGDYVARLRALEDDLVLTHVGPAGDTLDADRPAVPTELGHLLSDVRAELLLREQELRGITAEPAGNAPAAVDR